jgi:PilX N-terminal
MKFKASNIRPAQQGFALIVALVLLLVMTMVAVVAMRSTTLDLKMTTNTALNRRAFQASEGVRMLIGPILDSHTYEQGKWPEALVPGGVPNADYGVPALEEFAGFIEVVDDDPTKAPFRQPYSIEELEDPGDARHDTPDFRFFSDADSDGEIDSEDIRTDVWVTKLGEKPDSGKILGQDTNLNYVIYEIRAIGRSGGNARVETRAEFRALLN